MKKEDLHIVLGATNNSERISFMAVNLLNSNGYNVVPLGIRKGEINGLNIINPNDFNLNEADHVHTVTLYLNPQRQKEYYDFITSLAPERIIFNPGTENPELEKILNVHGIDFEQACTLVLLNTGQY